MTHHTIRLERPTIRLELDIRLEPQETHDGQLDTDLQPVTEGFERLSISASFWDRGSKRGRWREDCFGQCIDRVTEYARDSASAERVALERLCEIWRAWHLNDVQAGTTLQTEAVALAKAAGEITNADYYGTACVALANRGLLDDRGYRYGSKWLVKRLPAAVRAEVSSLVSQLARGA